MDFFTSTTRKLSKGLSLIGVVVLSAMMTLTCADVVLRYFGHPIKGAFDLVGIFGGIILALPLAASYMNGYQISMTAISIRQNCLRILIAVVVKLVSIGTIGLIAWRCVALGNQLWDQGRVSDTLGISVHPFLYIACFGFAVYLYALVIDFVNFCKKGTEN